MTRSTLTSLSGFLPTYRNLTGSGLLRAVAAALFLFASGCTSYELSPVNDWIRLHMATPTAVLPHTWYVGESWTRVEYLDSAGKWTNLPRFGQHPIALLAYDRQPIAIAIENSKHDSVRYINIYSQSGTRRAFEVPGGFLNAIPHLSKETVLILTRGSQKAYVLDEYNFDGVRTTRLVLQDQRERPEEWEHLKLEGYCNGSVVFAPASWDKARWLLLNDELVALSESSMPCEAVEIPSCVGSGCDSP